MFASIPTPIFVSILVPILVGTIVVPIIISILVESLWQDEVAWNNRAYSQGKNTRKTRKRRTKPQRRECDLK